MPTDITLAAAVELLEQASDYTSGAQWSPSLTDEIVAFIAAYRQPTTPAQAPNCGSYACKASQRDGVICADGECDIEAGIRPAQAPAQAPVAWRWRNNGQWHYGDRPLFKDGHTTQEPLYAAPQPSEPAATGRVPLTEEQARAVVIAFCQQFPSYWGRLTHNVGQYEIVELNHPTVELIRAIERAHGIAPTGSAAPTGEA